MKTRITKADKILIALLALLNIVLFTNMGSWNSKGDWVVIEVGRKEVARLPLLTDRIEEVKGPLGITQIEVKGGRAHILRSPCKNKICIKAGYIQYADRLAACIPNRVVVRILGESHRGLDAVVG